MVSYLGLAIGVLFLAAPLAAIYFWHISLRRQLFVALTKMLLRIGLLGLIMYYLVACDSIVLNVLFLVLMVAYSTVSVLVKARLGSRVYCLPVAAGLLVATVVVGGCLLFVNMSVSPAWEARYTLPVIVLMSGGAVDSMAKALRVYYMGALHHGQLYYYLLGNGSTRAEALNYLVRRAMQKSLIPGIGSMAGLMVSVTPAIMLAMVMCGVGVFEAACMQFLVVLASLSASVVATFVALAVARRYSLDAYGRLKNRKPKETDVNETVKNEEND